MPTCSHGSFHAVPSRLSLGGLCGVRGFIIILSGSRTVTSRCILYCEQRMKCLSAKQIEFGRFVWGEGVHHYLVWIKDCYFQMYLVL